MASSTAAGGAQWGVGLVVQEITKVWSMDSMRFHRPNVVKCEVVSGDQRTPFIGA